VPRVPWPGLQRDRRAADRLGGGRLPGAAHLGLARTREPRQRAGDPVLDLGSTGAGGAGALPRRGTPRRRAAADGVAAALPRAAGGRRARLPTRVRGEHGLLNVSASGRHLSLAATGLPELHAVQHPRRRSGLPDGPSRTGGPHLAPPAAALLWAVP